MADVSRALVDDVRRLGTPVAVGMAGSLCCLVGSLAPDSPVVEHTHAGWFLGVPWPPASKDVSVLVAAGLFWVGVVLLARGWVALMRVARAAAPADHNRVVGMLVAVFALWAVPLFLAPPLLTRDMPSYAAQGEIYSQGFDPYNHTASVLGGGEFVRDIDPLWRDAASPYGPLFMILARTAVRVAGHRLLPSMVLLKLVCLAGVVLMAGWLPRLARASGHSPPDAVAIVLLNPITLIHLVGGAHNDALMVGLLIFGLAMALEGRPLVGTALCVLAGAVKLPALAGVAFIAWHWATASPERRERVRRVALGAVTTVATLAAITLLAGTSWKWLALANTPTAIESYISPVTTVGTGLGALLSLIGIDRDAFVVAWQALFFGVALVVAARCLWRVRRLGLARATGTALLAVALLSPVLFPFYLMWGLALLAAAGLRRGRWLMAAASVGFTVTLLPGGIDLGHAIVALGPVWLAGVAVTIAVLWWPLRPLPLRTT